MTGYRILGLVLLAVAIVTVLAGNWIAAAFCALVALFCLLGRIDRIDRTVHDVRKDGPRA